MNCSNIRPLLSAYFDNDVSTEERTQVEMHLAGCVACRRALAEYRVIGSNIRSMAIPQPPTGLRRDVWRAIEAQQAKPRVFGNSASRGVVTTLPQPREGSFVPNVIRSMGKGWAMALPAALLLGGLLLALSVILLRGNSVAAASMVEDSAISNYSQPVHVQLNKQVIWDELLANTSVLLMGGTQPVTITNDVTLTHLEKENRIVIQPNQSWIPGAQYKVYIDAPNVGLTGAGKLDSKPIELYFSAAKYTPTPTSTPTKTPVPTETPVPPTNTPQPTTVAQISPEPTQGQLGVPTSLPTQGVPPTSIVVQPSVTLVVKVSPTTVKVGPTNTAVVPPTNTPVTLPTSTPVVPTRTPVQEPTRTPILPTLTPVPSPTIHVTATISASATATVTVIVTATPRHGTPTAIATPRGGTPSATPTLVTTECDQVPVRGFGKIWQSNQALRQRIGCASALEMAIPEVAIEHFQGGLMVWRADIKRIYVFINGGTNQQGIWVQFSDTWQDSDIATHSGGTPPTGLYEPVRGFGKLWNSNGYVRQSLGWATDLEVGGLTGALQEFDHGSALWTSDLNIYFMYNDDTFQRFVDTWVGQGGE